jgi:membrane protease subunit (stomatin/prohibitin family)
MGLIKAALGAAGGVLADQWKDFFICEEMADDVLVMKGHRSTGGRSANTKGSDNVITNGSVIHVYDNQFMILTDGGKIIDYTAEPGYFIIDNSSAPSLFQGQFKASL